MKTILNKKLLSAGIILITLLMAGSLIAQRHGRMHDRQDRMAEKLNLSEEQKSQISKMRLALKKELLPLKSDLQSMRADIKLAMTAENFNQKTLESLVKKQQDLRSQIQLKQLLHKQAVRKLLTVEQREKFDSMLLSDHHREGRRAIKRKRRMMKERHPGESWDHQDG